MAQTASSLAAVLKDAWSSDAVVRAFEGANTMVPIYARRQRWDTEPQRIVAAAQAANQTSEVAALESSLFGGD